MKEYRPRIADILLKKTLERKGAVLIEGPKWCGKTTTAEQISGSAFFLDDPTLGSENILLADVNPKKALEGKTPRLLDEWQLAPKLWDAARFEIDHRHEVGQFILTGSSVPVFSKDIHHSGTGRFSWLLMRTMSLFESGESSGAVRLCNLFSGKMPQGEQSQLSFENLAFSLCRGGWPRALDFEGENALEQAFDYVEGVMHSDVSRASATNKNPQRVARILRSLARHQGTQASNNTIREDISQNEGMSISLDTFSRYVEALQNIFVIEDMESWNPNLRSKTSIRTSPTRYFVDPSIAVAALGIGPHDLLNDIKTFGLLFETMCMRDLRTYAEVLQGKVYHYRDKTDLECDAVVHLRDGKYGLIEIKLGGEKLIEEGAQNLLKLAKKLDTTKMKEPSFLMVMTGAGSLSYVREDGVCVVPIGCLRD